MLQQLLDKPNLKRSELRVGEAFGSDGETGKVSLYRIRKIITIVKTKQHNYNNYGSVKKVMKLKNNY